MKLVDEFKKDCDAFSKVGEQISQVLEGSSAIEWIERRNNFETWITKAIQTGSVKSNTTGTLTKLIQNGIEMEDDDPII